MIRRVALVWLVLFLANCLFAESAGWAELLAGALFASAGTAAMEAMRRHTRRRFAVRPRWLPRVLAQGPAYFADLPKLLRALAAPRDQREAGVGRLVSIPFDGTAGRDATEAAGRRALVTSALCFAPNSVVLGLEMVPGHLVLHELEPGSVTARDPAWPI